jgi:hypothetical protein
MSNFFLQKSFAQLYSLYSLALKFFGERISLQKLLSPYEEKGTKINLKILITDFELKK